MTTASSEGHLDRSQGLAVVNKAARNTRGRVCVSTRDFISLRLVSHVVDACLVILFLGF